MKFQISPWMALLAAMAAIGMASVADANPAAGNSFFKRISTFNICEQIDPTCNTDVETSAETLWYYESGESSLNLVYTDSPGENLGFVDITDPSQPKADGTVPLGGEPTTVRILGDYGTLILWL